jgi:hypothetical protein
MKEIGNPLFETQLNILGDIFDKDFILSPEELSLHANTYTQHFFEENQVARGIALKLANIIAERADPCQRIL